MFAVLGFKICKVGLRILKDGFKSQIRNVYVNVLCINVPNGFIRPLDGVLVSQFFKVN